eukprot:scaffold319090_cov32-Prasinocladus_malaysianus.AAC.1
MRDVLLSKEDELDSLMYVSWNPGPQLYNTRDLVDALAFVYHLPYTDDSFLFELGGERTGRADLEYALAHMAAILGQASQESLASGICDEVSWGDSTYEGRPGCGQRGKGYSWPVGGESYGSGMFYCLDSAETHKSWSEWYGSKLGMDVCGDPSQICSEEFPSAKYWTAFGAWAGSVINNYDSFDFTGELVGWVNAGYPKSHSFVNGIGGLLNMGSAWVTAHANEDRQSYTQTFLNIIRPWEHSKTY